MSVRRLDHIPASWSRERWCRTLSRQVRAQCRVLGTDVKILGNVLPGMQEAAAANICSWLRNAHAVKEPAKGLAESGPSTLAGPKGGAHV